MSNNTDIEEENKKRGTTSLKNNRVHPSYFVETHETMWTAWLVPMIVVANTGMFVATMYLNNCPINNTGIHGKCFAKFLGKISFQPLKENPLLGPSSDTLACPHDRVATMYLNNCPKNNTGIEGKCFAKLLGKISFPLLKENPLLGPSSDTLQKLGALDYNKVVNDHQAWRLFACIWLHAGVVHLLANMLSLIFIGIRLEQQFGFIRVGAIYMISGIGGSVLSSLFLQSHISVGASGALFGLLGAMLSELLANWSIYTNKAAALITLVVIIVINLALGILPHVDNFAHIGGFISGFLLGFVLLLRPQFAWTERRNLPVSARPKSKHTAYQYAFWVASLILLVLGLTGGLVALFKGENGNDHCDWCHYLSCVPTSLWKCN